MKKLTLTLILTSFLCFAFLLASCQGGPSSYDTETYPDTTEAPTEAVTLSPEEQLAADRQAYLDTVTYRDFVLTGENQPYYMVMSMI